MNTNPKGPLHQRYGWATAVDMLRWRAEHQAKKRVFTFLSDGENESATLSFGELDRQARAIAAALQAQTRPGERALLIHPPGLEFIAAFFGCLYAGVIAVPLYPPRLNRANFRHASISEDCQPAVALTSSELAGRIREHLDEIPYLKRLKVFGSETSLVELAENWTAPSISAETVAFLQYTSGSTSSPRGVIVTHRNLLSNEAMIVQSADCDEKTIKVSWLPHFHDMGLMTGIVQPIYAGFECLQFPPSSFIQHPAKWLKLISKYRATETGGPNFAVDVCTSKIPESECSDLDLSHLRCFYISAEPVRIGTINAFHERFRTRGLRREAFNACYGLAEATLVVSGRSDPHFPLTISVDDDALRKHRVILVNSETKGGSRALVSSGTRLQDGAIVIVNPDSVGRCPNNEVGEIWASGPHICQGYWGRGKESQETFRASITGERDQHYLRTGDLGFLLDGQLFVTGRLKDMIIIRGRNYYPHDIERSVENSHVAVAMTCCAAFSLDGNNAENLAVVAELQRSHYRKCSYEEVIHAIRGTIIEEHDIEPSTILLLRPNSLPKTSSGKIRRSACKAGTLDGSLETILRWDASASPTLASVKRSSAGNAPDAAAKGTASVVDSTVSMLTAIQKHIAMRLAIAEDDADLNRPIKDMGFDSLGLVNLAAGLETELGVSVPMEKLADGITIAELVKLLGQSFSRPGAPPLKVFPEQSSNLLRFNVMADRPVEETLFVREYRVWDRYIEAVFHRAYKSTMLASPDHLIFLSALVHTQKILYVYLCHEFGFAYDSTGPEKLKLWPIDLRVFMPQLVTETRDLVQRCWITQIRKVGEKRFVVKARTTIDSLVITGEVPVFIL